MDAGKNNYHKQKFKQCLPMLKKLNNKHMKLENILNLT